MGQQREARQVWEFAGNDCSFPNVQSLFISAKPMSAKHEASGCI